MSHRRKIQLRVTGLIHMVKTDFNKVEMELNEEVIKNESKQQFKLRLKKLNKNYMLQELRKQQDGHKKIREICYNSLETQNYSCLASAALMPQLSSALQTQDIQSSTMSLEYFRNGPRVPSGQSPLPPSPFPAPPHHPPNPRGPCLPYILFKALGNCVVDPICQISAVQ